MRVRPTTNVFFFAISEGAAAWHELNGTAVKDKFTSGAGAVAYIP